MPSSSARKRSSVCSSLPSSGALGQSRRRDLLHELEAVGHELVQRRVEQPDRDRHALHRLEHALEVLLLQGEQLIQHRAAAGLIVGHDHDLHLWHAVSGHEHVLGSAQADALGTEAPRAARVLGSVRVGAHAECAQFVAPAEYRVEAGVDLWRDEHDVLERDGAGRAVDRDQVAFVQDAAIDVHLASVEVDVQVGGAGDRGAAHPTRHKRGVRGLAAFGGKDALGGVKARDIVGFEANDVAGFHAAKGILTSEGSKPRALVARGMGRPAVTSAANSTLARCTSMAAHEGDLIAAGAITLEDDLVLVRAKVLNPRFDTVLGWCDELRFGVRANADTPEDARRARGFGAEGIGLCRTELMAADRMRIADHDHGRR